MSIKQTSAIKRVNHCRNLSIYDVKTKRMRNDLPIFPSLEARSVEYIVKGLPIVEHLITIMEKVRHQVVMTLDEYINDNVVECILSYIFDDAIKRLRWNYKQKSESIC